MAAETEAKRSVYVHKPALTALAQYGPPTKVFPVFSLIHRSEKVKAFAEKITSPLPALEPVEESATLPNVLDIERWLDSIDNIEDATYAAQIGKLIYSRLPESYRQKIE